MGYSSGEEVFLIETLYERLSADLAGLYVSRRGQVLLHLRLDHLQFLDRSRPALLVL